MNYCTVALCTIISGLLPGCGDVVDNENSSKRDAFAQFGKMTVTATPDRISTGSAVAFTTRCIPLLTGKGRLFFGGSSLIVESRLYIESPIIDTLEYGLDGSKGDIVEIPVEFRADMPSEQTWILRFSHNTAYRLGAWATIDSVYLPDSLRYFSAGSPVVREYYGVPRGAGWSMSTPSADYLLRP